MTLRSYISTPDGSGFKRGSLARVSEHIGVCARTVRLWATGACSPTPARAAKIRDMIAKKLSIEPDYRRCGRPKGSVNKRKNGQVHQGKRK